jgi:hypothetical protein
MGTNVLTISAAGGGKMGSSSSTNTAILDESMLEYIEQNVSNISKIAPSIN